MTATVVTFDDRGNRGKYCLHAKHEGEPPPALKKLIKQIKKDRATILSITTEGADK